MPLPMSIERSYSYVNPQGVGIDEIRNSICSRIEQVAADYTDSKANEIVFENKNSLFYIPYRVTLQIDMKEKLKIKTSTDLTELIKVILLIMVGAIFITTMAFGQYLVWSIVSLFVFYFVNVWLVQSSIYRMINTVLEENGLYRDGMQMKNDVFSSNTMDADSVTYQYKKQKNAKKDKRK